MFTHTVITPTYHPQSQVPSTHPQITHTHMTNKVYTQLQLLMCCNHFHYFAYTHALPPLPGQPAAAAGHILPFVLPVLRHLLFALLWSLPPAAAAAAAALHLGILFAPQAAGSRRLLLFGGQRPFSYHPVHVRVCVCVCAHVSMCVYAYALTNASICANIMTS